MTETKERRAAPDWGAANTKPKRSKPRRSPALQLSSVEPEEVRWLWRPYIPYGMVTLIEGDPGLGKSWITMAIAAAISAGTSLPGQSAMPPQKVLILNAEDSLSHTVVPRLISLGADRDNIYAVADFAMLDPEGLVSLESYLREVAATIIFIDPLVAYLGSKMDMHRANEVRTIMAGLYRLAEKTGCAIIAVRHLRKAAGGKAIYRGIGSIDFSAAVRSVLAVEETKSGATVIFHIKSNLAQKGPSIAYSLAEETEDIDEFGRPIMVSKFEWGGTYDGPDRVVNVPKMLDKAVDFLKDYLSAGHVSAVDVFEAAQVAQISTGTLKRAKKGLVRSFREDDVWYWELLRTEAPQ